MILCCLLYQGQAIISIHLWQELTREREKELDKVSEYKVEELVLVKKQMFKVLALSTQDKEMINNLWVIMQMYTSSTWIITKFLPTKVIRRYHFQTTIIASLEIRHKAPKSIKEVWLRRKIILKSNKCLSTCREDQWKTRLESISILHSIISTGWLSSVKKASLESNLVAIVQEVQLEEVQEGISSWVLVVRTVVKVAKICTTQPLIFINMDSEIVSLLVVMSNQEVDKILFQVHMVLDVETQELKIHLVGYSKCRWIKQILKAAHTTEVCSKKILNKVWLASQVLVLVWASKIQTKDTKRPQVKVVEMLVSVSPWTLRVFRYMLKTSQESELAPTQCRT